MPSITSLSPGNDNPGGAACTMPCSVGSNFLSTSTVEWNSSKLTTTVCQLDGTEGRGSGHGIFVKAGTDSVTVVNPTHGGGTSSAVLFYVNNPVPAVTSISPGLGHGGRWHIGVGDVYHQPVMGDECAFTGKTPSAPLTPVGHQAALPETAAENWRLTLTAGIRGSGSGIREN